MTNGRDVGEDLRKIQMGIGIDLPSFRINYANWQ